MKTILCGILAMGLLAAPAQAYPADDGPVTVQIADLDLTTPRGAAILMARLERAAERVCSSHNLLGSAPTRRAAYRACEVDAVTRAAAHVSSPEVRRQIAAFEARERPAQASAPNRFK